MSIAKLMMRLGIMLAVGALVAVSASPVMAQPVTSPFSGDVTIDGDPAPDGSEVAAYVGDETEPRGTTTTTGGTYEIMLFGTAGDVGKAVSFKVKKAGTEVWLDATTNPENPTHANYDPQVVNLFASATASVEHVTTPPAPPAEEKVEPPAEEKVEPPAEEEVEPPAEEEVEPPAEEEVEPPSEKEVAPPAPPPPEEEEVVPEAAEAPAKLPFNWHLGGGVVAAVVVVALLIFFLVRRRAA